MRSVTILLLACAMSAAASAAPDCEHSRWGAGDEIGNANLITAQTVLAASELVKTGETYSLGITIDGIFQDEPVETFGDGSFAPDGQGVGTSAAEVRAERAGTKKVPGNGRVYHIFFTADDGFGGTCEGKVLVGVPHNKKKIPVDDGPLYNSTIE